MYVEDELAENSDDEKRLSRADARASKKFKSAAQKNGKLAKRLGPKRFSNSFSAPRSSAFFPGGASMLGHSVNMGAGLYHVPPVLAAGAAAHFSKSGGLVTTGFGPCFECGMPGHLRKYCPKLLPGRVIHATKSL